MIGIGFLLWLLAKHPAPDSYAMPAVALIVWELAWFIAGLMSAES
jgi:hypothetical protein